jgi:hypothetical protein
VPGIHALCALALLHAGQAINDDRLNIHSPFMVSVLERLKSFSITPQAETYTRSLRATALAVYNRKEDRGVLDADARWLVTNAVKGAYTYSSPPPGTTQPSAFQWDNSNSQYGALGLWAADDAGFSVPGTYWSDVEQHWTESQAKDGGWHYRAPSDAGTLSMTAAAVTMLFVANEQLSVGRPDTQVGRRPFSEALGGGLDWLAKGDNAVNLGSNFPNYALYGMERAGLASGFKMFGNHDWYRELAARAITAQSADGSWGGSNIPDIDTAFNLLFLARGRHPITINKLRYIGAWANRPRDVARLTKFTSREIERALNWQVVDLAADWSTWTDCPILYMSGHEAPILDESDFEKLRAYCAAGGLLFTHADGNSKEFNQFAELLAQKLFGREMQEIPPDHLIFNALFHPKDKPRLRGIGNGARLLMIHSPEDIARKWQLGNFKDRTPFEFGANLFVYATGKQVPRNRLDSFYVEAIPGRAKATIPIARLKYAGDWDPEPYAWQRMARLFRRETSLGLAPTPTDIEKLTTRTAPLAHLTGLGAVTLTDSQLKSLKNYVDGGGVLLVDACAGARPFVQSIKSGLLARAFGATPPEALRPDHPILAGKGDGLVQIVKPQLRPYVFTVLGGHFPKLQIVESGKGAVLFSELDLTSGLLGTNTLGIVGYDPDYAARFISNTILWTVNGRGMPPAWTQPATTQPSTRPD